MCRVLLFASNTCDSGNSVMTSKHFIWQLCRAASIFCAQQTCSDIKSNVWSVISAGVEAHVVFMQHTELHSSMCSAVKSI